MRKGLSGRGDAHGYAAARLDGRRWACGRDEDTDAKQQIRVRSCRGRLGWEMARAVSLEVAALLGVRKVGAPKQEVRVGDGD